MKKSKKIIMLIIFIAVILGVSNNVFAVTIDSLGYQMGIAKSFNIKGIINGGQEARNNV